MSKHTPGPWVVHDHPTDPNQFGHHVTTVDGLTICSVTYQLPSRTAHGVEETTRVANAHLIAAAPDLLDALQVAELYLRERGLRASGEYKQIEAALAKATGTEQQPASEWFAEEEPCPECRQNGCDGVCMEIP